MPTGISPEAVQCTAFGLVLLRSRWNHDDARKFITRGERAETIASIGGNMTAIIYNFDRWAKADLVDETERLFSALERYTTAQLLELLYVGEEPGFFELVRGLFGLSDDNRLILQKFLSEMSPHTTVTIDAAGRCVLTPGTFEREKPVKGIA